MTFEQFKYVVDKFEGLRQVNLTGAGESLLNPDFIKMVDYLKHKKIASQFITNGSIMTEAIAKKLINSGMQFVVFSFDTADKYLFEELRPGLKFEKFIRNVSLLSKMKKMLGSSTPALNANCVVSEKNYQKLNEFVELAHELGFEHINFIKVFNPEQKNLVDTIPDSKMYLVEDAIRKAYGYNMRAYLQDFKREPITKCDFPWKGAFIAINGDYYTCCYTVYYGRFTGKKFSLGNVFKQSIEDIVNGEGLSEIRQKISSGIVPSPCSNCPQYGI
jgi:radical SAM protein with 4Fe4S-binding SPASM domain